MTRLIQVDLEEEPLALDLEGAEITLAVGVVVGLEAVEGGNRVENGELLGATERDYASST